MLTVTVRLDFFRTQEFDGNPSSLEVCATLPPKTVDCLSNARLRTAKRGTDELAISGIEALEPIGNGGLGDVNAVAATRVCLVHQHPFEKRIAGTGLASRVHSRLIFADDLPSIVDRNAS